MHTLFQVVILAVAAAIVAESRLSSPEENSRPFWQCPIPLCIDPCVECNNSGGTCVTKPTYLDHYWKKCRGCPKFVRCEKPEEPPVKCCKKPRPPRIECGRSGCTCCSNGEWVLGNSGPTLPPDKVCMNLDMQPSKPCTSSACSQDVKKCKDGSFVERDPSNACEFFPCPKVNWCTKDVKKCSDGSFVSRNPEDSCEFFPCPTDETCGSTICSKGMECCNASCGICVESGGACIQKVCDPLY